MDRLPRISFLLLPLLLVSVAACRPSVRSGPVREVAEVVRKADGAGAAGARRPPNFVVILADDLGYGDIGAYGGRAIRTPNLDALAAGGMRFTDFHASDSVCTPSRAGLLTGRYARRMGLDVPLQPTNMSLRERATVALGFAMGSLGVLDLSTEGGTDGLHADEITLPEALRVAGYRTGMVGKWHLGDFGGEAAHNPTEHGFDRFYGVPYSNDMHPFPLFRGKERIEDEIADQTTLTRRYTEEAVRFLEEEKGGPFFLYLAHNFPHRPLHASDRFLGRSAGGLYGDTVEELDWSVGEVVAALERLGLAEDTLLLFTSDNGPWYDGSPGGLRGRKGQSFEGGHRVPLLARWPGHVAAGAVAAAPSMNIDFFPTLLELAGLAVPSDREIDGRSLARVLSDASAPSPHEKLYFYHEGRLEALRSGRWKAVRSINHYLWPMPVNKAMGRLSEHTTGPLPLLFDMEADPDESYNLAMRHGDLMAGFDADMARWDEAMDANRKGWKR